MYKDTQHYSTPLITVLSLSVVSDSANPRTVALQAPLSMGNLKARILEWVAMPSSSGSSQSRDQAQVSHIAGEFFPIWAIREALTNRYGNINQKCSDTSFHIHYDAVMEPNLGLLTQGDWSEPADTRLW